MKENVLKIVTIVMVVSVIICVTVWVGYLTSSGCTCKEITIQAHDDFGSLVYITVVKRRDGVQDIKTDGSLVKIVDQDDTATPQRVEH